MGEILIRDELYGRRSRDEGLPLMETKGSPGLESLMMLEEAVSVCSLASQDEAGDGLGD